jgi:hypothetical protein
MPNLKSCTIKFHTNDDDKDGDTHVTITVRDANQVIAARIDNDFGHFNDNSDNGPFGLIVKNPSPRSIVEKGSVNIRIDPNGNDNWRFNFYLELVFDDGNILGTGVNGLDLNQDHRDATFAIEKIHHS